MKNRKPSEARPTQDALRQSALPPPNMPSTEQSFAGLSNLDNSAVIGFQVIPPDTQGDVGPNHYVQWVNLVLGIWDKNGNLVVGPLPGNAVFAGLPGDCSATNDGDPIVLYDQLADRWVLSQFAITANGHQCIAVSKTGDPTGEYWLYDFTVSVGGFNDYPKLGVWPDGYYLTANEFFGGFTNAMAVAFQRDQMLQGLPAAMVKFAVPPDASHTFFSLQPAHLEGLTPPPASSPNPFLMAFDDQTWGLGDQPDRYELWQFHVDWTDPSAATFTGPIDIPTTAFDAEFCGFSRSCIPQPGGEGLDVLGQFTMYRLVYRNFGDHETLLVNHTVDVNGASLAGIRWTEIRDPNGTPAIHQTGTFAPDDGTNRWMGSLNMDISGNIALGYSVSSGTVFPSIRATGRLAEDPPGEMTQGELEIFTGAASQIGGFNRWGDYSTMSLDETDECTFWYTNEYQAGGFEWHTRIASFRFPNCSAGPSGEVTGTVTSTGGLPLAGATVAAGAISTITDPSGVYSLRLPVGTHTLTASKFGFLSSSATVEVTDGATIVQDFALEPASTTTIDGFIYDGSGASWPVYSKIVITAPGAPATTVFNHPLTGYYNIALVSGIEYTFTVTPLIQGYVAEARPVAAGGDPQSVNIGLRVDAGTCNAPGYALTATEVSSFDFEAGLAPWTAANSTTGCVSPGVPDWTTANPGNRPNLTGGTGAFAIADADICGPTVNMNATLTSPAIDLSGIQPGSGGGMQIELKYDYRDGFGGAGNVQVWNGSAWETALHLGPADDRGPKTAIVGSTAGNGRADAAVRLEFLSPGWFWWWEVDDVKIRTTSCEWQGGGLIYGFVSDGNTGDALNGATVSVDGGSTATTVATPEDPAQGDGFYIVYTPGARQATAHKARYADVTELVIPQWSGVMRHDFALPAGRLTVSPTSLTARVPVGGSTSQPLALTNSGEAPAGFAIKPFAGLPSALPEGPFDPTGRRTGPKDREETNSRKARFPFDPQAPVIDNAGQVVGLFPTGLTGSWGIAYNIEATDLWVGSISVIGGDDLDHRFLPNGVNTGDTISANFGGVFAADGTYNPRTGMLWQVNVGGDNCIYELDPIAKAQTGNKICPAFGTSERGLAYDPVSDTFYAGSWNDGRIQQFDTDGNLLRAVFVGLDIAGLAYNPSTRHLFVMTNSTEPELDVYVVDSDDMTILGAFNVLAGSVPAFGAFEQAGLELDCDGNLVMVNQTRNQVVFAESGELNTCITDVPWLTVTPNSGVVPPLSTSTVSVGFNSAGLTPGIRGAQLVVQTDTPYEVPPVPVTFTVAFRDVAAGSPGDFEIHLLAGLGIAGGCGGGNFCPNRAITRAQIAPYLLLSKEGPNYEPPEATGLVYDDVGPETFAADFIEELARRGVPVLCGGNTYCPNANLLRKDAAVFILRTVEGGDYVPPPPSHIFNDVPDDFYLPWIDELARRGITNGCGGGRYCPNQGLSRSQAAIFMVKAFGLEL